MRRRQPLPRSWLMTDERQGDEIWHALARLPKRSGIVFRHYGLAPAERRKLLKEVKRRAARERHLLLVAGPKLLRCDGTHGRMRHMPRNGIRSAPVHNLPEIRSAERAGADLLFLSPVFRTRSHPGARSLGRTRFADLARRTRLPVIALGGMDERRARRLVGAYGWGGIDAWSKAGIRRR